MTEVTATVGSIRATFGSWIVFNACTQSGKKVRMIADLDSQIAPGEYRTFVGQWENYKQTGKQFRVHQSSISSVTDAMVEMFLSNQTGIGKAFARKLLARFGTKLPYLLDSGDSATLSSVEGIGEIIAQLAIQGWQEQGAKSELVKFIAKPLRENPSKSGLLTKAVLKAHQFYRGDTLAKLQENPYLLWAFCTWEQTDYLAKALGIPSDDRRRLLCAIEESLYRLYGEGHTSPQPLAVANELETLLDTQALTCVAVYEAARDDGFHTHRFILRDDGGWSLPAAFIMETYVEAEMLRRAGETRDIQLSIPADVDSTEYLLPGGDKLDRQQEQAVSAILNYGVVVVIGAAGTGKTRVLYAANDLLHRTGRRVLQVALTGKAAQRLMDQTGQDAFTIEALLTKLASSPHFLEAYDLPVLFIDEASMVDLPLMYRILKAFDGLPLKIVAIGDRGQLPPIGPGLIFHKMVESTSFHVVELKTNYRALAGSTIPSTAQNIRSGSTFRSDEDVIAVSGTGDAAEDAVEQYLKHQAFGTIQIVSATNRVMARVNRRLQARLLAGAPFVPKAPEFRIGDKVIYKKNNRRLGLVNGSLGIVIPLNEDLLVIDDQTKEAVPADIAIEFANEGTIPLLLSHIKNSHDGEWYLQQAYAITCHQAQGSEFDCVIVALEGSQVLDRSWLYTAVTRARR